MIKIVLFAALVAVASAGLIATPAATSHSSISQQTFSHSYAAPVAHYAAAPALSYAAPVAKVAYAAPVAQYAAPVVAKTLVAAPIAKTVIAEAYAPAQYDFEYSVNDPNTGDVKSQKESRQGDAVQGYYTLIEADGSRRIVEYTADEYSGFNAIVHREPAQHAVAVKAVAPVITKTVVAAPVLKTVAAPVVKYAAAPAATYVSYGAPSNAYHY